MYIRTKSEGARDFILIEIEKFYQTVDRVFALHVTNPVSIPSIPDGTQSPEPGMIPQIRTSRSNPQVWLGVAPKQPSLSHPPKKVKSDFVFVKEN